MSFNILYESIRKEKALGELQKLETDVYKLMTTENESRQDENTEKLLLDLYEKRRKKIIAIALADEKTGEKHTSHMLPYEKDFYQDLMTIMKKSKEKALAIQSKKDTQMQTIQTTESLPKFVDTNLNTYGPFQKDFLVAVPKKIAHILVKRKKAIEIHEDTKTDKAVL